MSPRSRALAVAAAALLCVAAGVGTVSASGAAPVADVAGPEPGPDTSVVELGSASAAADNATEIADCVTISSPGVYRLTADITNGGGGNNFTYISEACIIVAADDVVLDGGGHSVDGMSISDTTGVAVVPPSGPDSPDRVRNVTVRNLVLTDWNRGVYVRNAADATVRGVHASGNSYGVVFETVRDGAVADSTATYGYYGVYLADSNGTTLRNNTLSPNRIEPVKRGDDGWRAVGGKATPAEATTPNRETGGTGDDAAKGGSADDDERNPTDGTGTDARDAETDEGGLLPWWIDPTRWLPTNPFEGLFPGR